MKKKIIIALCAIIVVIMMFSVRLYIDNETFETTSFDIVSSKLPDTFDGYKIVHISDLHSKSFGVNNEKLLTQIDEISPDIVVLTGDMVNGNQTEYTVFLQFAKAVAEKYTTYYIYGNHEESLTSKNKASLNKAINDYGIIILDNNSVSLEKDGYRINLYGFMPNIGYYRDFKKYQVTEELVTNSLGEINIEEYNVLLSHSPKHFEVYSNLGFDLILSGHIHGGMIRLPFIGGLLSPDDVFFPKYDAGVYEIGESKLVVSRGLNRGARGFRLFNVPELVVTTLKCNEKSVD